MLLRTRLLVLVSTLLVTNCGSIDPYDIPASHFIVTSGAVIPKTEFVLHVNLLRTTSNNVSLTDGKCTMNVTSAIGDLVAHQENWTIEPGTEPQDFSKTFGMMVNFDIDEVRNAQNLRIESSGCFQFNYSSEIPVALEDFSIAIQTDKDVYEPGDLVMFRVFSQLSNWKAYQNPLDIIVVDSRGEVVTVWSDVVGSLGVISRTYLIPQMIEDGQWTISVRTLFDKMHNKSISVVSKGYEQFLVRLDAPRYQPVGFEDHENQNLSIDIRVVASRFSGLPVVGILTMKITLMNSNHSTILPPQELENGLKRFHLDLNKLKSQLNMSADDKWFNKTILVSAEVEELYRRSSVLVESAVIEFTQHGFDFDFHEFTPGVFRPGWEVAGWITLKSPASSFFPKGPPNNVTLKITHNSSSPGQEQWNEMMNIDIQPNGVGRFLFESRRDDASLELQTHYHDKDLKVVSQSRIFNMSPLDSDDDHMLQVTLVNESPVIKSGQQLFYRVKTTFPTRRLNIEIFSQKLLVISDTRDFHSSSTNRPLSLSIPHDLRQLLATSRLVVWTQSPSGEIVSDSLLFVVEETRKKVQLVVKPAFFQMEDVEIEIKASPNSTVHLFATANPPIFEDAEQEKDREMALEKMKRYTNSLRSSYLSDVLDSSCKECSTIPSLSSDSMKVFNESHGLVFGTSSITNKPDKHVHTMLYRSILEKDRITLDFDHNFWKTVQIGATGSGKVMISVQAKIALYTISAVSVHDQEGLNVAEPVQVRIRSRVLTDILYPERVVVGESFNVEIGLFKTWMKKSNVDVWFKVDPPMEIICNNDVQNASEVYQVVQLNPQESKSVFFHVRATSTLVPGAETEFLEFLKVEESPNTDVKRMSMIVEENKSLKLSFENDERSTPSKAILTIYGDIMGPAVEYALRSIEHPNVVDDMTNMRMAITTYTLDYIYEIDIDILQGSFNDENLLEADVERLTDTLWTSIQHIFHRQHADGYFLSPRSIHGPIKCTSVMLEAMVEWKPFTDLDKRKIVRAVTWLIGQQQEDGSFAETMEKFRAKDGDELKSQTIRLTCHVLLSFIQSYKMYKDKMSLDDAISKSIEYLMKQLSSGGIDDDGYALSMFTYALTILNPPLVQETREKKYKLQVREVRPPLEDLRQESLEIETSAYDLLTHLSLAELKEAKSIANWLVQRMGPDGRFVTSGATMAALKALSRYSSIHNFYNMDSRKESSVEVKYSSGKKQMLTATGINSVHRIAFDKRNSSMIDDLEVNVSGGGRMLLFQLERKYDESSDPQDTEVFHLNQSISQFQGGHQLKLCMEWMPNHSSGPVMVEIPVLSGYYPDMERNRKMLEEESKNHVILQEGVVYVALNEFERGQSKCLKLNFVEEDEIVGRKEKFIEVYSRLNMNKRSKLAYHDGRPDQTTNDICPSCDCNVSNGSPQRGDTVVIIIVKQRRA